MAEIYLKNKITDCQVFSAGINAMEGIAASSNSQKALKEIGLEADSHLSKRVSKETLEKCDLVLTMTLDHKIRLLGKYPQFKDKIYTLKEYALEVDVFDLLQEIYNLEEKISTGKENLQENIKRLEVLYEKARDLDVADPFGGNVEDYIYTLEEIKKNIDIVANKIKDLEQ